MKWAYYNEIDKYCGQWLHNLIAAGLLPPGDVDTRSIKEVTKADLHGYTQAHFFAGLGGWPLALRLADWSESSQVWTGSPPCQPFSQAGKKKGTTDDRHLWPDFYRLIDASRPATVFIEQVARTATTGWLDVALHDLEKSGYSTGAAVLPACSVGTPHQRDRLWIVANADRGRGYRWDSSVQMGWVRGTGADAASVPFGPEWATKPAVPPVAHDVPCRMEQCRAYGNAIVPELAAEFIRAFMDCRPC